ncbi:MAG: endonuclease [Bacteroidota bacterium]
MMFSIMRYSLAVLILVAGLAQNGKAQYHLPLFPELEGEALTDELAANYRPFNVLDYSRARDTLFRVVYGLNDSLSCVYSGHRLYMNPNIDPTDAVFLSGQDNGINTEHTWPQSLGAGSGFARSDMHHLFPTRVRVNGDRGSLPFGESNDSETEKWYYKTQSLSSIPSQNIDLYSELATDRFEPREDHKGNVARALFYFYTIYRAQANQNFFQQQRETLCQWHLDDPVDELEWQRTFRIAQYQDGKPNPFVLDCTLPERSYCSDLDLFCQPTATSTTEITRPNIALHVFPNPATTHTTFAYQLPQDAMVQLKVMDTMGRTMAVLANERQGAGDHTLEWQLERELSAGLYFVLLEVNSGGAYLQTLTTLSLVGN